MAAVPPLPLSAVITRLLAPELDIATQTFSGLRVLVRADLNVPLSRDGSVADRERVDAALPTLRQLAAAGARVVVASHMGRPEPGKEPEEEMRRRDSLRPVAALLTDALGDAFVGLADDCVGPSATEMVARLRDGQARPHRQPRCAALRRCIRTLIVARAFPSQVCLLENTRFDARDTKDDASFAAALAALCDVFVLDGFGVCHRTQASVSGVARLVRRRFPGPLVRRELHFLGAALDAPQRPFGVVLGGMKARTDLQNLQSAHPSRPHRLRRFGTRLACCGR